MTQPAAVIRTNTLALVGFIVAFVIPIAAIPLCVIARQQIIRTGEEGAGLARAGLVIGIIATALGVVFVIAWFSVVLGIMGTAFTQRGLVG